MSDSIVGVGSALTLSKEGKMVKRIITGSPDGFINTSEIKVKRLHPSAVIPTYATDGSGCFDITAVECVEQKGDTATYRTGLAFEIPHGKAMILYGRSGYAFNRSLRLATCTSVIDSDFRGELLVKVRRDDGGIWYPSAGDRIAQAMIVDAPHVKFIEVDELSDTKRGDGGFGSTGV